MVITKRLKESIKKRSPLLISFLIFIAISATISVASQIVNNNLRKSSETNRTLNAERYADRASSMISDFVGEYQGLLIATRGLFSASNHVSRDEWHTFMNEQQLEDRFIALRAITFAPRIALEEFDDYQLEQSDLNQTAEITYPKSKFVITNSETDHYPVTYIAPNNYSKNAFGFDLYSENIRKKAIELAIDLNSSIITEPINLLNETGTPESFLLVFPIYKNGEDVSTLSSRKNSVVGIVSAVVNASELISAVLKKTELEGLSSINIYDITDGASLLASVNPNNSTSLDQMIITRRIPISSRIWEVKMTIDNADLISATDRITPILITSIGILIALLISLRVYSSLSLKIRAESTARKLNKDLTSTNNLFSLATRAAHIGIWEENIKQKTINWTKELYSIHGLSSSIAITPEIAYSHIKEDQRDKVMRVHQEAKDLARKSKADTTIPRTEYDIVTNTGGKRRISSIGMVTVDEFGELSNVIGIYQDITEQKNNEDNLQSNLDKLKKAETAMLNVMEDMQEEKNNTARLAEDLNKFKLASDSATDQIIITNPDGEILYANPALEKITGFSVQESIGRKAGAKDLWGGLMPKEFYSNMWHILKDRKQAFSGIIENRRKSGETYSAQTNIAPVINDQGEVTFFVGIERDITKEKKAKEEMTRLSERLSMATKSGGIGVWEWDVISNDMVWDSQMYDLYGITQDKYANANEAWEQSLHPEDKEEALQKLKNSLIDDKEFDTIFRVIWPNNEIHHIKAHALLKKDKDGTPIKMVGVNLDVTHEMEVDRAKSEFVSIASHQLRTPLSSINWYAEMLNDGDAGELNKQQKEYVQEITFGNKRMVDLVNALLDVSRIELGTFTIEPEEVNPIELANSIIDEMKPQTTSKNQIITLENSIPDDKQKITADPRLLRIIFQNLVSNAVKYTPENGEIKIHLDFKKVGEEYGGKKFEKNMYVAAVSDNGYGIPSSQHNKIFQKLFRADNIRAMDTEGTGLGLYTVRSIIQESNGEIWFTSEEDKGTTFFFTLPEEGMRPKVGEKRLGE